jgi:hypothetical protein
LGLLGYFGIFSNLGVLFQPPGNTTTKDIDKILRADTIAIFRPKSLRKTSIVTAIKLFGLAVFPVASYMIEAIWPYFSVDDLNNLEKTKSRYLKRVLSMDKTERSRLTYELIETDFCKRLKMQI